MIKTRFAPRPTGLMHLGKVRTALFNHCLVRREKGVFLLRIENTDPARGAEGSVAIVEDLRWLGLDWDEGSGVGSAAGALPPVGTWRGYADYYRTLEAERRAYPCFCTAGELAMTRKAQLAAGTAPRYPGTCARFDADRIEAKRRAGSPATLRFRVPQRMPLRAALTGRIDGPDLAALIALMPREGVRERFAALIKKEP
ncbi:MAG: glutamate--tRNA ligase family protein [Pseudomonadota bacterium]|nr:glutamate--tRNA ligase family protein [Pseudomonadota bacterium]